MNTRIEKKEGFKIAGLSVHEGRQSDFSGIWDKLFGKFAMTDLYGLGSGEPYGACYDFREDEGFSYMAGYDVKDEARAASLGLEILAVPPAEYVVLELVGAVPGCIREGWGYFQETYRPGHSVRHAGTPDFEYYLDGDTRDPDYRMELWIPVIETNRKA